MQLASGRRRRYDIKWSRYSSSALLDDFGHGPFVVCVRSAAVPVRKQVSLSGGRTFALVVGDLLAEPVDAIVNAANDALAHGGGVARIISRAAGPEFDEESAAYVREHGYIATGNAAVTGAGTLSYQGVIHAVGPRQGEGDEEQKLTSAVANALLRAHEKGWRSISFPAISSGIFGVPLDICSRAYVAGVQRHFAEHSDSSLRDVRICLLDGPLVDLVLDEMDALQIA